MGLLLSSAPQAAPQGFPESKASVHFCKFSRRSSLINLNVFRLDRYVSQTGLQGFLRQPALQYDIVPTLTGEQPHQSTYLVESVLDIGRKTWLVWRMSCLMAAHQGLGYKPDPTRP